MLQADPKICGVVVVEACVLGACAVRRGLIVRTYLRTDYDTANGHGYGARRYTAVSIIRYKPFNGVIRKKLFNAHTLKAVMLMEYLFTLQPRAEPEAES